LKGRVQYTEVSGEISKYLEILAGVPQGSILGPLLFLIYINDLPNASEFFNILFADDTSLLLNDRDIQKLQKRAEDELMKVEEWFATNKMHLNSKKTKYMLFNLPKSRTFTFELKLSGIELDRVSESGDEKSVKLVGITLDENLTFKHHVDKLKIKLNKVNFILARSRTFLPKKIRLLIYNSLAGSILEFGSILYGNATMSVLDPLIKLQKKLIRNVYGVPNGSHTNKAFAELKILKLPDLIERNKCVVAHKLWYETAPKNICQDFKPIHTTTYNTRVIDRLQFDVPLCRKAGLEIAPVFAVSKSWNRLDLTIKEIAKVGIFKSAVGAAYLARYREIPECTIKGCYACSLATF